MGKLLLVVVVKIDLNRQDVNRAGGEKVDMRREAGRVFFGREDKLMFVLGGCLEYKLEVGGRKIVVVGIREMAQIRRKFGQKLKQIISFGYGREQQKRGLRELRPRQKLR